MRGGYRLATGMTGAPPRSRHGFNRAMARVKLRGFRALDSRTRPARQALAFKSDLVAALGGEADLSPQRRKLVDLAARATLLLDHIDAWLVGQRSLINARTRTVLPVVVQRQALADHLVRLLDKLGLDRVPQKVTDLTTYLAQKYPGKPEPGVATGQESPASPGPGTPDPAEPTAEGSA